MVVIDHFFGGWYNLRSVLSTYYRLLPLVSSNMAIWESWEKH